MGAQNVQISIDGAVAVVALSGDLVEATMRPLPGRIQEAVGQGVRGIVVDMNGVEFVDSSGIKSLIELKKSLDERRARLILCEMSDSVYGVFERLQLESVFNIKRTKEKALRRIKESL
ncbi:MAG: STAS domain-containing protein [bacterium]